jgi:hypothetical protein
LWSGVEEVFDSLRVERINTAIRYPVGRKFAPDIAGRDDVAC